jgi:hypothetical protein
VLTCFSTISTTMQARSSSVVFDAAIHVRTVTRAHTAGTTGSDVLYAGVPVVTLPSARTLGRMGASLLHRVGLSVLIARSESEFVRTAAALMRNRTA